MHTLAFATQKGGVGKTTCTVGVAETLVEKGKDVLAVDVDAQCNLSRWLLQARPRTYDPSATLLHAADPDSHLSGEEALHETEFGVDLIPAHPRQNARISSLNDASFLEGVLQDAYTSTQNGWDFILIDTPPYIGASVWAAMATSDSIFVPIQLEGLAFEGLISLMEAVEAARDRFHSDVDVLGIFPNQVDVRRSSADEGIEFLESEYGDLVFDSRLRQRAAIAHASTTKQPILQTAGDHVNESLDTLTDEILDRINE